MFDDFIKFVRELYGTNGFIPLHEPRFSGNEKQYLLEAIDSTYVSSVGRFVNEFESRIAEYTGATYAIATVNGTAALHMALLLGGVQSGDEIITQPLSFVATANAIHYCGAKPIFIDVDSDSMGLSPESLEEFLIENSHQENGRCYNNKTNKVIRACVPMHTFGHPCRIDELNKICQKFNLTIVEDAAEALGSTYKNQHLGTFGDLGIFSFNGNKIITCGGGGVIVTNNKDLADRAKHLTTTAKIPHAFECDHDEVGYNYRLPNINAALACAQMENLPFFIKEKRSVAAKYDFFFTDQELFFIKEDNDARATYWLNSILCKDITERNHFLKATNDAGIMTRPAWNLLNTLAPYKDCQTGTLTNAYRLAEQLVNIPSSVPP